MLQGFLECSFDLQVDEIHALTPEVPNG